MRKFLAGLALAAVASTTAGAQMKHEMMHKMSETCPLELKTLNLSAKQQTVFDSIRAEHQKTMKAMMPMGAGMKADSMPMSGMKDMMTKMSDADRAAMEKNMQASIAAVRKILTPAQLKKFNAAVAAHEKEMKMPDCCRQPAKP